MSRRRARGPAAHRREVGYVDHFRRRVMQDALVEALPEYWRRRADTFDLVGNNRCDEIATACRHHADLIEQDGLPAAMLVELVAELDRAV